MILAEVRQAFVAQCPKQFEQFPRRDFVGLGAPKRIRRSKNCCDHTVAPREQAATFDVRFTPRVRQDFV